MDFSFSSDQRMLADSVERYVSARYLPDVRIVRGADGAQQREMHRRAFADMGLFGLTIGEDWGGFGGGGTETAIVMEAFGKGLVTESWVGSALVCASLLAQSGNEVLKAELLPQIASGELQVALAHAEPQARHALSDVETTATAQGEHFVLNGRKSLVVQGGNAKRLLVSARTSGSRRDEEGISLFVLDPEAEGVSCVRYATLDGSSAADFEFKNVHVLAAAMLHEPGGALPMLEHSVDAGATALCAEAVGIMSALLSATLDYVKTRKQFGVNLSSFQALQHRLVDMHMHIEQARSLSWLAASKVNALDTSERKRAVSAAKWRVGTAARLVGKEAIQMHGGIGMTDELIVGHYVKRLMAIEQTFGDTGYHLKRFIQVAYVH
ncbi:pimeloyl-CoA dehydrogenase small subunit [Diaphorobacter sp. HDW4A]|uniref:acyl-CoA dehydrogenase family protein n=1 Tax=Diaphorobacter sp. HDW4A TaxID=2714924 RepID=UPI00140DE92A|nr:acyl-CoA dehydrogenase family protein [Diaphorobacter sp. HDW4A]QIL80007.1 pimeloyl-CoA dehydrogenase small subunit [Diaphorobacter sp. HDW4A]